MKLVFLLLVLGVVQAGADTSIKKRNPQRYGNCHVTTHVDMLTDEVDARLWCQETDVWS